MKNFFIFLFCEILMLNVEAKWIDIPGEIKFNDSIKTVVLSIPISSPSQDIDYEKAQNKIYFYNNGAKEQLQAQFIKEIRFTYKNENIVLNGLRFNLGNPMGSKYCFLKKEKTGRIKKYKYYASRGYPNYGTYNEIVDVIQIGDGDLFVPAWFNNFELSMKKYFQDCQKIVDGINNKTYSIKNLDTILEEYEKCN